MVRCVPPTICVSSCQIYTRIASFFFTNISKTVLMNDILSPFPLFSINVLMNNIVVVLFFCVWKRGGGHLFPLHVFKILLLG